MLSAVNDGTSVRATIEEIGVQAAAQRYVQHMENRYEWDDLIDAFWSGDDETGQKLPSDLLWRMLLAAIHECPDDDEMLWRLGDGPIDNNSVDPEIREALFQARDRDPKVMRLFEAMRRQLPTKSGITEGSWFT